jgi:gamma-glutamyltranspeptidase/glutathione hydrolase
MTEAKKIAFADRARYYADPDFAKVPVAELVSKSYAKQRAALIDMQHAATRDIPGDPIALNRKETTYLCTADESGMMVSLIQSNYTGFGSGYVIPELGFGLQDRGNLFDLHPGRPNSYAPGKRPFHTIIPAFATRGGQPWLAFGLMGGDMQPQGQVQVLVNMIDFGMNVQEGGEAARVTHGNNGLLVESNVPEAVRAALIKRGHKVTSNANPGGAFGGYQGIMFNAVTRVLMGGSDVRKDGLAIGY